MQPSPVRDLIVGLFVAVGLAAIAYLSIQVGGVTHVGRGGLVLYATFYQVGGLKPRAPVSIAGVTVGQVRDIGLDDSLKARVTIEVDKNIALPVDSEAAIQTVGLLGDQFVAIEPGGADEMLKNGDEFERATSAISIEGLIGKFVHNSGIEPGDSDAAKSKETEPAESE